MASKKSNKNKTFEVGGIRFETLVPEREILIPTKNGDKTPVQFGIRVTNLSEIPYRFIFFGVIPELQDAKGNVIERSYARNITNAPQKDDVLLAMPNGCLTFFVEGELYCYEDKLELRGSESSGGIWTFRSNLSPDRYSVRFIYENLEAIKTMRFTGTVEGLWTGKASTPWEEFRLVY